MPVGKQTKNVSATIPKDQAKKIEVQAKKLRRSASSVIAEIIDNYFDKGNAK